MRIIVKTAADLINTFNSLKEQILGWPDNVIDGDPQTVFTELELQLKNILEKIITLNDSDRAQVQPALDAFREAIVSHHEQARQKLDTLKEQVEEGRLHQQAIRAYTKR